MKRSKSSDLTVIYYTSNFLDEANPYFLENTKKQLLKAIGDLPLISVSQKPIALGQNLCLGNIGRSHLNIYRQILEGCKVAKTKFVAMAEDDILYSFQHFHDYIPNDGVFAYDMNKWSIFTWSDPPVFSYRHRKIVNSLVCGRQFLIDDMEERFARLEELKKEGKKEEDIISFWGDPGRYENHLGITVRPSSEFVSGSPSIVFSHPEAFGYVSRGERKRLGQPLAIEIPYWGRAEDILKLYHDPKSENLHTSNANKESKQ